MSVKDDYPKVFEVTLRLRAPANATDKAVRQVIKEKILAAHIQSVREVTEHDARERTVETGLADETIIEE